MLATDKMQIVKIGIFFIKIWLTLLFSPRLSGLCLCSRELHSAGFYGVAANYIRLGSIETIETIEMQRVKHEFSTSDLLPAIDTCDRLFADYIEN